MQQEHLVSLAQLPGFCHNLLKTFSEKQLILLDGPLGAGKTAFVKECVRDLQGDIPDSPTFSVINCYQTAHHKVYHVDLYRLESDLEIESTGFWDLFLEDQALIFVEWAQKVPWQDWPRTWPRCSIEIKTTDQPHLRKWIVTT